MDEIADTLGADHLEQAYDFELQDLIDEANIDQFIDLNRGENEDHIVNGFDCDLINGLLVDSQFGPTIGEMFEFNANYYDCNSSTIAVSDPINTNAASTLPRFEGGLKFGAEDEETNDDNSSPTTTKTTTTMLTTRVSRKINVDRRRTLISERRRRGWMKENLYALRSLVPNISKMDKASIVGDATLYLQELQMQAKKLKAEVASLEATLAASNGHRGRSTSPKMIQVPSNNRNNSIAKRIILQVNMFQMDEREIYVRLVCNKGVNVAAFLYKALECLTDFAVQSSNLATTSGDTYVFTFTLKVKETNLIMGLQSLELWVKWAFLNQGFELLTFSSA